MEFLKFLLTGGTAAAVNLISRFLLNFAIAFEWAVAVAHVIGMGVAYVLARRLVFGASGRAPGHEFARFAAVNVVSLAIVWTVSVGLARIVFPATGLVWHAEDIAHVIGVSLTAVTSYFGHKYFTFRSRS